MTKSKKELREDITHLVRRAVERSLLVGKEPAIANYSKNLIDLFNQALKQQREEILKGLEMKEKKILTGNLWEKGFNQAVRKLNAKIKKIKND